MEETKTSRPFSFSKQSPLVQQTEQKIEAGYESIEQKEQGRGDQPTPTTVEPEETKGIQTYIPMSLYSRLVMLKLKTKEPLGSMFQQAIALWLDVQEGKTITSPS